MAMERSFASLGAELSRLEGAWQDRLRDAEHLFAAGRYSSSVVTGLYSLEIRLKVRICLQLDIRNLPKAFEIHDLEGLLVISGLSRPLRSRKARAIRRNWVEIGKQSKRLAEYRYLPNDAMSRDDAERFFAQLTDPNEGIMPWISNQP